MKKLLIQAPGRINLIGEHLDYNQGIVLPAAINRCFEFEFELIATGQIFIEALDLDETWVFEFAQLNEIQTVGWKSYVKGVFLLMDIKEPIKGLHIRFKSNIPIGAGLSSSAALCCGLAFGLNEWFNLGKTRMELALLAQQTEHQFAGVQCGLMDQVASLFGKEDHLLAFDCLSQEIEKFKLPLHGVQLFLIDSKVKHNLAESAYNERRAQLELAWDLAQNLFAELESWRTIEETQVSKLMMHLDSVTQKRLRYVLEEISRVQKVQKLAGQISNNLKDSSFLHEQYQELGVCLNQTHQGLRDLYEVSCEELDFLQNQLLQNTNVLGARMMGGGFGGCLLVLATSHFSASHDLTDVFASYELQFSIKARFYPIQIADGVHLTDYVSF